MPYFSQLLGTTVVDAKGEKLGRINDLGVSLDDVFPRVSSLAFQGSSKTPFMIPWRKYVESYSDDEIVLNVPQTDIRFSYLQSNELLLRRDIMSKQIIDTQTTKVVRASDLKLSPTSDGQLRLLGAEVGARGRLRGISPKLESVASKMASAVGRPISGRFVAWGSIDLPGHDLSQYRSEALGRSIEDLHPADIADIIEQLDPELRGQVFKQLDPASAAETMSELDDEVQTSVVEGMDEHDAADVIAQMNPDDAADIIGELPFEHAETLLNLMDPAEEKAIRTLLGYTKNSAGGNMTSEFVAMPQTSTIADVRRRMRSLDSDFEPTYYVYTLDEDRCLVGVLSMRDVVCASDDDVLRDLSFDDLITVSPETDQRTVVEEMTKYSLVSLPVVDEGHHMIGLVSVDDALDVIEEDQDRDRDLASGTRSASVGDTGSGHLSWFVRRELWFFVWVLCVILAARILPAAAAVPFALFLPIVLLVADDILSFAASYLIGNEEAKPRLGTLVLHDLSIGIVIGALGWLVASIGVWTDSIPTDLLVPDMVESAIIAAMVTVAVTITLASVATIWVARNSQHDRPTQGVLASLILMVLAAVIFGLLTMAIGGI